MGNNYVSGDKHGNLQGIVKFNHVNRKELTKEDYIIIAGDWGFPWNNSTLNEDLYWLNWIDKYCRATILFVDGNHDRNDLFAKMPVIEMFGGGVNKINNSVYHLMRGNVYNINDIKIFTFGGAYSIDTHRRIEGKDWWPEEMPSKAEEDFGLENLEKHGNKVDYIITHDAPFSFPGSHHYGEENGLKKYLNHINTIVEYKYWFFGHHHVDIDFKATKENGFTKNFRCLYHDIIKLER